MADASHAEKRKGGDSLDLGRDAGGGSDGSESEDGLHCDCCGCGGGCGSEERRSLLLMALFDLEAASFYAFLDNHLRPLRSPKTRTRGSRVSVSIVSTH